jgi:hypothetical protein
MIDKLKGLGEPPGIDPTSWQTALADWDQAVELYGVGPEDWLVNMNAGAGEFTSLGIKDCGAIRE